MSPEQVKTLRYLSQLFQEGKAGPQQIKQLSELLASINHHLKPNESSERDLIKTVSQM